MLTSVEDSILFCFSGSPRGIEFNSVKEVLLSVQKVKSIHCLRLWSLSVSQALVSVHLAVGKVTYPLGGGACSLPTVSQHKSFFATFRCD